MNLKHLRLTAAMGSLLLLGGCYDYQGTAEMRNGFPFIVFEAPAGSMILFDTRTWHRAGINRSDAKRAAILTDITPAYIVPYSDTTPDYRALVESEAYGELNQRERQEWERLMIHRFLGPAGPRSVIGTDRELTERIPPRSGRRPSMRDPR